MSGEKDTTVDDLESTLKSLLATAEATKLTKGGVDNSGTWGSEGKQGGGQGSDSDAGPVEDLMIAKMIQAGVDVKTAAAFHAFMSKMDGEDEEGEDEDTEKSESEKELAKSFREELNAELPEETTEMVDITPYLNGLTDAVGARLAALDVSIQKSGNRQEAVNKALAKAVHQMGGLLKSQANVIDALGQRLGLVERAPVAKPKGAQTQAQVVEKSLPGEAGTPEMQLTKSAILSTLTYMNLEKGHREIGNRRTSDIVTGFESGNVYDQEVDGAVRTFLKSLSKEERQKALNYH